MKLDFSGKVAIVTGGARGIGAASAGMFAEMGAKVAIFDMLESEGNSTCDTINANGGVARFYKTDITNMKGVKANIDDVASQWGKVDILVCCAGIVSTKPCMECDENEWDKVMNINAKGAFNCCHSVLPMMMAQHYGKIVNLASVAAKTGGGFFGNLVYGASKAAVISYSKGIAREAGPYNVNVNVVCPSLTDTPMVADLQGDNKQKIIDGILLKRPATPEEVANVIVFLASDCASFVTSEIMNVDGGIMKGN